MYVNERVEKSTGWSDDLEELQKEALNDILDWVLPVHITVVIEEKIENVEFRNCPHCGGRLIEAKKYNMDRDYDYDCARCSRGWRIQNDGSWHSLFSANIDKYSKEEVIDDQEHKIIAKYGVVVFKVVDEDDV
jgi:hypothetical protein